MLNGGKTRRLQTAAGSTPMNPTGTGTQWRGTSLSQDGASTVTCIKSRTTIGRSQHGEDFVVLPMSE